MCFCIIFLDTLVCQYLKNIRHMFFLNVLLHFRLFLHTLLFLSSYFNSKLCLICCIFIPSSFCFRKRVPSFGSFVFPSKYMYSSINLSKSATYVLLEILLVTLLWQTCRRGSVKTFTTRPIILKIFYIFWFCQDLWNGLCATTFLSWGILMLNILIIFHLKSWKIPQS